MSDDIFEFEKVKMTKCEGLICFYIDVGQLPPNKTIKFVERFKVEQADNIKKLEEKNVVMVIPIRPGSNTRVDYILL